MSDQTNVYKLKEILARTDEELTGNWSRLASLIKNYEKMPWRDAQKLAAQIIRDGKAEKYVANVRKETSSKKSKGKSKKKSNTKKEKQAKVIPINTKRDRFSMNYKRLLKIAPDLIERLENGEEVYGKSIKTGYMDFNLELINTDKTGYYLAISHYHKQNGDMVPDPDMQILVNVEFETVQALAFQNALYYREVYDDIYNRKAVYMDEKKAQNSFLQDWLINLINQGHEIEWLHDKEELETSANVGKNDKPDISYMVEKAISSQKEYAENSTLDEAITKFTLYDKGELKLRPIALYFLVDRLNNSPLSIKKLAYPTPSELKEDYEKIVDFQKREDEIDKHTGMKKPDVSFVPEELNKPIRELIEKTTIEEAKLAYAMHEKGKQKLDALALFYIVEKLNESDELTDISYPKESEIKAYVESLKPKGYDKAMSELKKEIELTERLVFGPLTFKTNFEKLLKIAPDLNKKLLKKGLPIGGISKQPENDLNLLIEDTYNDGFVISLLESKGVGDDYVFGLMMKVFFSPKDKELKALSTYAANTEAIEVYEDPKTFEKVDTEEEKEQNITLGKWLDELYNQGHRIEKLDPIEPETGEVIEELKEPVKPESEPKVARLEKVHHNQVLKTNYQKLMRLVPNLFDLEIGRTLRLGTKANNTLFITSLPKKGDFAHVFELFGSGSYDIWTIHVQQIVGKVFVRAYYEIGSGEYIMSPEKRNEKFGIWLNQKIKDGYGFSLNEEQELLKKFPIVLEWTEGANDENVGFHSLEKLRTRLKGYGFTDRPTETYIKNKLWFRDYPNYVRIDLSMSKGDYNPNEQNLLDWLNEYDPNFDWSQFSRPRAKKKDKTPPQKSRKELQKEVENEIPDFKPGKVKLMPAHIKRGIKQKHIDWINKHKQGMTVTPLNRMVNNTEDFFSDMNKKAKKPGFRISRTGKLYYETRSNRSDITGKTL